jgi:hypothetical protein
VHVTPKSTQQDEAVNFVGYFLQPHSQKSRHFLRYSQTKHWQTKQPESEEKTRAWESMFSRIAWICSFPTWSTMSKRYVEWNRHARTFSQSNLSFEFMISRQSRFRRSVLYEKSSFFSILVVSGFLVVAALCSFNLVFGQFGAWRVLTRYRNSSDFLTWYLETFFLALLFRHPS